jgi:hypothetical protein
MLEKNAPVCVFGYNRPLLLKNTLHALSNCDESKNSKVYIFIDGPKTKRDGSLVNESYKVASEFDNSAFVSKEILIADKNLGPGETIIQKVSSIINIYGKVIVLEDDLIADYNFLTYMNSSLNKYENMECIGSVSGFGFKVKYSGFYCNYFHRRPTTWGWGTWRNRWNKAVWDLTKENQINKKEFKTKFNRAGQDMYRMLSSYLDGRIDSWGIRWAYNHHKNNWFASCPVYSKILNNGYVHTATNCNNTMAPAVGNDIKHKSLIVLRDRMEEDEKINKQVNWHNSNIYKSLCKLTNLLK